MIGEEPSYGGGIATMARGGPGASWLDRHLQTDEPEYLDRDDAPDEVKQRVVRMPDRLGSVMGLHEKSARTALDVVADIPSPRILELGAGHGQLSAKILQLQPRATLTVSDLDPTSVANIAASALGADPRVYTQVVDATAIDAADDSYDLVVFTQAFHHLSPPAACRAIAEATRVGKRFLIIDLQRQPLLMVMSALKPLVQLVVWPFASVRPLVHDGYISALRAYSRSALTALTRAAGPGLDRVPAATDRLRAAVVRRAHRARQRSPHSEMTTPTTGMEASE